MRVKVSIQRIEREIPAAVLAHPQYDFRIRLIPKIATSNASDLAIEFVNAKNLTPEQFEQLEHGFGIVRDRDVPVLKDGMTPSQIVERVARKHTWFNMHCHTMSWKHFAVRPPSDDTTPDNTDRRYCYWNPAYRQYIYTPAWATFLLERIASDDALMAALRRGTSGP